VFSTHRYLWQNWVMADSDYSNGISVEGSHRCLRPQKIISWMRSLGVYVSVVMMASLFRHVVVLAWFYPPGLFFAQHRRTKRIIFKINIFNFNFCCLLHISNLLGSFSGRQLYTGIRSIVCFTYIGVRGLVDRRVCSIHRPPQQSAHTDACKTYYTAYTTVSRVVRNMREKQKLKLNINLENFAFLGLCFVIISQCTAHKT
jgi:hypothetical protein